MCSVRCAASAACVCVHKHVCESGFCATTVDKRAGPPYIEIGNLSQPPAMSRMGDIPVPKMFPTFATLPGVRPGVCKPPGVAKPQPGLNKTFSGVAIEVVASLSQCLPGVIGASCGLYVADWRLWFRTALAA